MQRRSGTELLAGFIIHGTAPQVRSFAIRIRMWRHYVFIDSDRGELRCDETNIESFWASGSCFSRTAVVRSVEASAGWHFREVADGTKLVDDATATIVMSSGRERPIFEEGSCRTWMRW